FLVRSRELTEEEVGAYREQFGTSDPSRPSPYQRAVVAALRTITRRDAAPNAQAWRTILEQPPKKESSNP
ncbi:MAG: hypothetical protein ACRELF_24185, partial [Gemmataceae bacterium]